MFSSLKIFIRKNSVVFQGSVKPWVIQSFLTFDYMDTTPKCDHSLECCSAVLYCGAVCFAIVLSF